MAHRGNEVERVFPEGREFDIPFLACSKPINVWATDLEEALSVADGIMETDGYAYGCY